MEDENKLQEYIDRLKKLRDYNFPGISESIFTAGGEFQNKYIWAKVNLDVGHPEEALATCQDITRTVGNLRDLLIKVVASERKAYSTKTLGTMSIQISLLEDGLATVHELRKEVKTVIQAQLNGREDK